MSPGDRELLVIVNNDSTGSGDAEFSDRFRIVHIMSPRVFVIELPADANSAEISALPGLAVVRESEVTPETLKGLDETEALFIQAWSEHREESETQRRGEGFDWDADGFEPPDPPPGFDVEDGSA